MNRLCPESLLDIYMPRSCFSMYDTTNSEGSQIPKCKTELFKKSFHHASLKAWNDTPSRVRELSTLNRFKQQLKTHLKDQTHVKTRLPGTTVDQEFGTLGVLGIYQLIFRL